MERRRKLTRRDVIARAAKGAAVTGGGVVALKWVAPAILTVENVSAMGTLPDHNCYVVKVDPYEKPAHFEDLYNRPRSDGGPNHCVPDTNTNVLPGAKDALVGYTLDASNENAITFTLPPGCTFASAYSKAAGCDEQELVAGKNMHTFTFFTSSGQQKGVSNLQFIFCCPD